jgi:hypothetical protein
MGACEAYRFISHGLVILCADYAPLAGTIRRQDQETGECRNSST